MSKDLILQRLKELEDEVRRDCWNLTRDNQDSIIWRLEEVKKHILSLYQGKNC